MKNIITFLTAAALMSIATLRAGAQTVLAGGFGTGGMGVVNGDTYTKTGTLGNGGFPFVSASKDGSRFYASSPTISKLYFIDVAGISFSDSMGIYMRNLASSNEPNTLFGLTDHSLCRINTITKTLTDSILLGAPWQVEERPWSKEVWVSDSGKVHIVDYTSGLTATTMILAPSPYDYGGVKFTPGGTIGYKGASVSQKLFKINAVTKTVIDSISTAPLGFSNMVVSHDSSKLFVCNTNNNTVRIYNTSDLSLADSIDCGNRTPINIYRHPYRPEIWVIHHFNDSVSVFNENTKALIRAFDIAGSPWYIAFASAGTTSVASDAAPPQVTLYPNPSHDLLTVAGLEAGYDISVLSITGTKMFSRMAIGRQQSLDIRTLCSGTYLLRVTGANGAYVRSLQFEKM